MEKNHFSAEEIERYLASDLSAEEAEAFEKALEDDEDLRARVEAQKERQATEPFLANESPASAADFPPPAPPARPPSSTGVTAEVVTKKSGWAERLFIALLFLSIAWFSYRVFWPHIRAGNTFEAHFTFPENLEMDCTTRFAQDSSAILPESCQQMLRAADELCAEEDFQQAQEPFVLMAIDTLTECSAPAWYYLGLLRMKLEDPNTAIQCFAKCEDLDHFGMDIQWNMTLAFVQLAGQDPTAREQAKRAAERLLESGQPEARKESARKMLENL